MAVTRTLDKAATGETPRPPLSPRGLRSRTAIVDAAATMMRQSGVASTSLDDVLAAAGCGKSQLYHYFDDSAAAASSSTSRMTSIRPWTEARRYPPCTAARRPAARRSGSASESSSPRS